jgi:hypothetical protein
LTKRDDEDAAYRIFYANRDVGSADVTKRDSDVSVLLHKIRSEEVEKRDDEDAAYRIFYNKRDGSLAKRDDEDAAT